MSDERLPQSEIILYQTEDRRTRIQCRFQDETVWLTQKLMADLFQIGVGTVNHHLKAVFAEGELEPEATIRRYRIVQNEGSREIARQILAGIYVRELYQVGQQVRVGEVEGQIEAIGTVKTTLLTDEGELVSLSNRILLEQHVSSR